MIIFKNPTELQTHLSRLRQAGSDIGFVPTMGALHAGHTALIRHSKKENTVTVCSIFVNPTQFNDIKDFDKYPKTIEADVRLLIAEGNDILFLPEVKDVYPSGTAGLEQYPLGYLETILEGQYRPGHFQGVCQVMKRLLNHVLPKRLYMGQKDYQQCLVVKKLLDEFNGIELIAVPTVREADGLAMSSRNLRLSDTERTKAPAIFRALQEISNNIDKEPLPGLLAKVRSGLQSAGLRPDYVAVASADDLILIDDYNRQPQCIALIAAYLNEVRLIDNMLIEG
jgi:pantoate--beta-alanine ligase